MPPSGKTLTGPTFTLPEARCLLSSGLLATGLVALVQVPGLEVGQLLPGSSVLRTQRPGRLQVLLAQGRSFRLGGS